MFLGLWKVFLRVDPTKPRYCSTWNVKTALSFFESLKPLEDLTLRQLSYKTVLLLALTSAARAHELSLLDLFFLSRKMVHGNLLQATCQNLQAWSPSPQLFFFLPFQKTWRSVLRTSSKLPVSYILPHQAVLSQTVSRWLTRALQMAGVDLGFSGHSTRGASTSANAAAGVSVKVILERTDWASAGTFERFYHREQ